MDDLKALRARFEAVSGADVGEMKSLWRDIAITRNHFGMDAQTHKELYGMQQALEAKQAAYETKLLRDSVILTSVALGEVMAHTVKNMQPQPRGRVAPAGAFKGGGRVVKLRR